MDKSRKRIGDGVMELLFEINLRPACKQKGIGLEKKYKKSLRLQVATPFYSGRLFNNIDQFQTWLTFNELRTSTIEIQVNTGKYIIKHDEVFICELNCAVHRDLRGQRESQ